MILPNLAGLTLRLTPSEDGEWFTYSIDEFPDVKFTVGASVGPREAQRLVDHWLERMNERAEGMSQ